MTKKELIKAVKSNKKLVWNDPDMVGEDDSRHPIQRVFLDEESDSDMVKILYGEMGSFSEAEVPIKEISLASYKYVYYVEVDHSVAGTETHMFHIRADSREEAEEIAMHLEPLSPEFVDTEYYPGETTGKRVDTSSTKIVHTDTE